MKPAHSANCIYGSFRESKFHIETFNVGIDKLVSCLGHRLDAYKHLCDLPEITSDSERLSSAHPSDLKSYR